MPPHLARRGAAVLALVASLAVVAVAPADDPRGLRAEIFDAPDLSGTPTATRVDRTVDFAWDSAEPVPGVGDAFSARWSGTITPRYGERYTFTTRTDDGVRLWVDGRLIVDDWRDHAVGDHNGQINLLAGLPVPIRLEYYDAGRVAVAKLFWSSASQAREIVPASALSPAALDPAAALPGVETAPALPTGDGTTSAAGADDAVGPAVDLPPPAPPVAGETFNAAPLVGEVLVRRPQDGALVPLEAGASLPVGTRIDTRGGKVRITTAPARGVKRKRQFAKFSGAMFRVGQRSRGDEVVDIDLMHGDFEACKAAPRARKAAVAHAAGNQRVRSLWGSGKGRFRTRGRNSVAIVRGTVWNVVDRCDGTLTRVKEGVVDVEDRTTGRTVEVRAGESYLARAGRR